MTAPVDGQPVVLIVDDDTFVRAVLRDALKDEGYQLVEAKDGEEALVKLAQSAPTLVLLDLFMPRKSGLDALQAIRSAAPRVRVLVISSLDSEAVVAQALERGAVGFISKPFHPLEVTAEVRRALEQVSING